MDDRRVYLQLRHPPVLLLLVDEVQLCVILPIHIITIYTDQHCTVPLLNRCPVCCHGLWRGSVHHSYFLYSAIPGGWDHRDQ